MALESENQLGQYTLLEKIAQGGMAQVFKAKTTDANGIERLVVIKRILPHIASHPEYVEMLIDEAKIAVHFTHGNIAQVYDLGRILDDYFIVMEYVDGKTLSQIFRALSEKNKKIPLDILLYCLIEVCHGLSYIHRKKGPNGQNLGVVHRDISPQNIILSYSGNVKIIDFGVAKADFIEGKTEDGVLKGKFAYMSPEQTKGQKLDHRSDIFSTGILLWELATNQRLFKRKTHRDTVKAVQKTKFDLPSKINSHIPKAFDKIVKKALQRSMRFRYQDAMKMAEDLEKILFEINPDFRPVEAAKFLYKLFGPEEDEKEYSHSLFSSDPISEKSNASKDALHAEASALTPAHAVVVDEPTLRDENSRQNKTPAMKFNFKGKMSPFAKSILGGSLVFFVGTLYAVLSHWASDKAYLVFENRHPQMLVTLDHEKLPQAAQHEIPVSANTEHLLIIERQGFDKKIFRFTLEKGEHKHLDLSQNEKASLGSLQLTTEPAGATVIVNSQKQTATTPILLEELDPDKTYIVEFSLPGYQTVARAVEILAGKQTTIHQPLTLEFAKIAVTSTPSQAQVFLNGKEVGLTPLEIKTIIPNRNHSLTVLLPLYQSKSQNFQIKAGEMQNLHFELSPRENPK